MSSGFFCAVTVTVARHGVPGLGQELHLAHGPVPDLVAVEHAVVAVRDRGEGAGTVELGSADLRAGDAVGAELGTAEPTVVGLDPTDGGEQRPGDVAARVGDGHHLLGVAVGAQCGLGYVVAAGAADLEELLVAAGPVRVVVRPAA